tara:strand:+ start:65 stop:403 length:339 start_codon:yes stop_codon:yes gene_type:complete
MKLQAWVIIKAVFVFLLFVFFGIIVSKFEKIFDEMLQGEAFPSLTTTLFSIHPYLWIALGLLLASIIIYNDLKLKSKVVGFSMLVFVILTSVAIAIGLFLPTIILIEKMGIS